MYLLETLDTGTLIAISVLGYLIGLAILFLVIKAGVKAGTKELLEQLKFQNNLKSTEMIKDGWTTEQLQVLHDDSKF